MTRNGPTIQHEIPVPACVRKKDYRTQKSPYYVPRWRQNLPHMRVRKELLVGDESRAALLHKPPAFSQRDLDGSGSAPVANPLLAAGQSHPAHASAPLNF